MDRLTTISKFSGLPTIKELVESCGETSCADICVTMENCTECPVQQAFNKLAVYEDAGLTVKEVFALKEEIDLQRNSIQVLSLWLTKIQKRLEKLTPGGSEFYNDPDKCLDWLQMQNDSYKEQFKRRRKAEEELEQVKKELGATKVAHEGAVAFLTNLCRYMEPVESGIAYCRLRRDACDNCRHTWERVDRGNCLKRGGRKPVKLLKACPFCGGEAQEAGFYFIKCKKCGNKSALFDSYAEAVAAWNRRTPEWIPATKKRPEELDTFIALDKSGRVFETVNAFDEMEWITHWMPMPEPPEGWKEGANNE